MELLSSWLSLGNLLKDSSGCIVTDNDGAGQRSSCLSHLTRILPFQFGRAMKFPNAKADRMAPLRLSANPILAVNAELPDGCIR